MANDGGNGKKGGAFGEMVKAEAMIQLAMALPIGCLVGWGVGDLLDHHFHTGWMAVVGIILGAVGGFVQIFTVAQRFLKRGE